MIAIAFALEYESAVFAAKQDRRLRVAIWQLGAMGEAAADALSKKLEKIRTELVISAGFAGGLQPGLDVGDLVLGQNYSDPGLVAKLKLGPLWKTGNIITEPAIIEKGEGKRLLGEKTGCLVGDMETAHLAAVCAAHGVPMLSVRCISDALDDDMPVPAAILLSPQTGRPDPLALFRYLISHPKSVPGFNRLMKNAKTAQTCLAAGLLEILPQVLRT